MTNRSVGLLMGLALSATTAYGQVSLGCSTGADQFTVVRPESLADRTGDVIIDCLGGTPPVSGTAPTANISVTLNAPVTSRIVGSNTNGTLVEALLLIDDPAPGSQFPCATISCPFTIGQSLGNGANQNRNVYQGVLTNSNTVSFLAVPVVAAGSSSFRRFRVVNLRVNGPSASGSAIFAIVSATSSSIGLSISNPTINISGIGPALLVSETSPGLSPLSSPPSYPNTTPLNPTLSASTTASFNMVYQEQGSASIFQRNPGTTVANPGVLVAVNDLALFRQTETGFYVPTFTTVNGLNLAGLPSQGTRFEARFTGIPAGVSLYVATQPSNSLSQSIDVTQIRLINPTTGAVIAPTTTIVGGQSMAQLTVTSGAAVAVWEVLGQANLDPPARAVFPVVVSFSSPAPAPATVQVGMSFGPVEPAGSSLQAWPRFTAGAPFSSFVITGSSSSGPTITTTSLPNGQQQLAYNASMTGSGGVSPYTWTIPSGALPPGVNMNTSGVFSGTPTQSGTFNFTVRLTDGAGAQANAPLSILVRPPVSISTTSVPDGQVAFVYANTTLTGAGGLAPYSWIVSGGALPGGLGLSSGGLISGTPTTAGTFNFTVQIADAAGQTATRNFISVIRPRVSVLTTTLPNGAVTTAYSADVVGAGGSLPYSFILSTGSLPGGLSLAANGRISGTPTTAGTSNFAVQITDGIGQTAVSSTLSINISAPLTITTTSLPGGTAGAAYPATNLAATGGTPAYAWIVNPGSSLPGGLSLSTGGALTGTPTTAGTFSFVVRVNDQQGLQTTATLSIVVAPAITVTTTSLPVGETTIAYTATTLTATGGAPPYTWSVTSAILPPGLNFSTAGAITGTPTTTGTFNFKVRATDPQGRTGDADLAILVINPLTLTTTSLPQGRVTVPYSASLSAAGGLAGAPYVFSLFSGALPNGLSLAQSGAITGTPTAAGTFAFVARVTQGSRVADANLAITVIPDPKIITSTLPEGQVGNAYTATLTQTGALDPYQYAVVSGGALPPGLQLAASGVTTGVPTASGLYAFTIRLFEVEGLSTTKSFQLNIRNRVTLPTPSQVLSDADLGTAYRAALSVSGGQPPFVWTVSGNLPAGLTLDPAGFIAGTPTASGSFGFNVGVTDATGQTASGAVQILVRGTTTFTIPTFTLPSGAVECRYSSTLQAQGGTAPYTWTAIGLPSGLALNPTTGQLTGQPQSDGSFVTTFIVTDANGQSTRQQLRFNVAPGLAIISPESIDPVGADQSIPVAFAASGGTPPYNFSLDGGTLPTGLSLDGQGLLTGRASTHGVFGIAVKVADACGATARRVYPVRILPTRLTECSLAPQPESLKFTIQQGTGAVTQGIGLAARCAAPLALTVQVEQQGSGARWLSASPDSLTATAQQGPGGISVTANPGSLPVGTYTGSVNIGGTLGAAIPVTMSVVAAPLTLQVSPVGLTFTAVQGGPSPGPQNLNVVSLPRGPLSWSANVFTTSGGQWLSLSAGGGVTDTAVPGVSTVAVRVSPLGLTPGEYYGTIDFVATGAANPIKTVTIVLNVLGPDSPGSSNPPTPDVSGLIMTGSASRTVLVTNPSRTALTYTTSRHPLEGRIWFTVDPPSGAIAPGNPLSLRITPDPASITEPGVRRSILTVRFSDSSFFNIEVVQIVPRVAASPTSVSEGKEESSEGGSQRALAGCTATRLVGVFTTLPQNFNIPVGWPTGVDMEILDDCTERFNSGSATVGFSCCDSPKAMVPLGQGRWSTTWVARAPQNTEVAVTGDFATDSRAIKGTHSVSGVIARTGNPPIIAPGGALSGATFSLGQPLAPGILTSIFGQRLADELTVSQSLPLTTTLGATSASLGGKLLPLFFTSDGQVNSQLPFDLPVNQELSLILRRGAAMSAPETVTIASTAPGMFTRNQRGTGQAAVVDVAGRVIDSSNAAPAGGVAILFATGLGAVDQPVQAGFPAPGAEPLARTVNPVTITVGGVQAQLLYAGLAPGFVGLYQINFLIPSGVTPGAEVPLVIVTGGASSSPGTLAIR